MVGSPTIRTAQDAEFGLDERLALAAGRLNIANSKVVDLVAELLETEAWQDGGKRTAESYPVWKMGLSSERAKRVVAAAHRRSQFPVIGSMFARGEVWFEQVDATVKAPSWADAETRHR